MGRRADWRDSADDPRSAFGWFVQDRMYRRLPLPLAFLGMALLGASAVAWCPWPILLLPAIALHVRLPRTKGNRVALATVPPPGPAFACRVEIRAGDLLLGDDEGVLTFVRGWAHFAGPRTEFSIRRADVATSHADRAHALLPPFGGRKPGLRPSGSGVFVALRDGTTLTFRPRGAWSGEDYFEDPLPVWRGFWGAFRFWGNDAPEVRGVPTLPPRSLHPSGLARAWRDYAFAMGSLFAITLALDLVARGQRWTGLLFVASVPSFIRLSEAYRRRKRERKTPLRSVP